jgi:hypothetical protein
MKKDEAETSSSHKFNDAFSHFLANCLDKSRFVYQQFTLLFWLLTKELFPP